MTAHAEVLIPDPLGFAADALAAQGALVERADGECVGVLPEPLAARLGVPETCTVVDGHAPGGDRVPCGIGSPLLERLTQWASGSAPTAALRVEVDAPRSAQARALVDRFAVRNAVFDVQQTTVSDAAYVVAWFAWKAEADDRYDGRFALALHVGDGAESDPALVALADPSRGVETLVPVSAAGAFGGAARLLVRRSATRVRGAIAAAHAAVSRRHARDHHRITEYFGALVADTRAPRRRVDAAAIAKKVEHLTVERDAKLRDLAQRYTLRVSVQPLAVVALVVPSAWVHLRVRRRKREGELVLRLPAGAGALDRLACAACGEGTTRPALCDDALHVLCEGCVPHVQGRPECAAC